jgi:hypothetical protein
VIGKYHVLGVGDERAEAFLDVVVGERGILPDRRGDPEGQEARVGVTRYTATPPTEMNRSTFPAKASAMRRMRPYLRHLVEGLASECVGDRLGEVQVAVDVVGGISGISCVPGGRS